MKSKEKFFKTLLFAINVDWYFNLHWRERLLSKMTSGYDVHLCLSETAENNSWEQCTFHRLNLSRSSTGIRSNFSTLLDSMRAFWKVKPDTIHSVTVKPNVMFGLLSLIFRKPIIITIPGLGTIFSSNDGKAKTIQRMLLFAYWLISWNRKACFVFENASDLDIFKKNRICDNFNSVLVPGAGVNITRFNIEPLHWGKSGKLHLLFASRLLIKKGLHELVDAVTDLRKDGVPVVLNVAGLIDQDSRDAIPVSQVEQWHKEGKVNWLGQVDQMESVIASNHVIVLPTQYGEGLPRILLEANACGRPVIATDIPGCNDFVKNGKNGFLIEPGNISDLKSAIRRFKNKDLCITLGENGRKLVEQFYTDSHVIECYKKIYNRL